MIGVLFFLAHFFAVVLGYLIPDGFALFQYAPALLSQYL